MADSKLWTVHDRFGNAIYLTLERWGHIIDPDNHAELEPFLDFVAETVRLGRRRQDPYDPRGYQYYRAFPGLPDDNTHIVVSVDHESHAKAQRRQVKQELFVFLVSLCELKL